MIGGVMDPISASSYNLGAYKDDTLSIRSLSRYERRGFKALLPQLIAASISTSNHIVVGLALAYSAVLIPQLESEDSEIAVTKTQTSWIASVFALIAPIGALLSGLIMDKIGRLNTLKISVIPGIVGWSLIATSSSVPMLIAGRVISGLASSLSTNPAIVYITEIARKDMRGSLLAFGPSFVSLGMVIAYLKGWLLHWKTTAWLCNIYIIVPFFLLFIIPESPVWLISKGKIEEARKALAWLYKHQPQPENQDKSFAELQLDLLLKEDQQKKLEAKMSGDGAVREFLKPTGYKPLLIISGVFFFQQFSGIYIFLFYSVSFFEAVGTSFNPYVASIWIGVIRLVMSLINTWMLKYCTRRILMMISAFGMAVSTFVSGLFTLWIKQGTTQHTWIPVIFLLFYVVTSMIGLLTIPWTMTAELFPLKIRSMAHSIATSIVNGMMFAAVQSYVSMEIWFGGSHGVQWFFSGVSLATVFYVFVFLPETHGKTLPEIEEYFKHNTVYLGQQKKKKKEEENKKTLCDKNESDKLINQL